MKEHLGMDALLVLSMADGPASHYDLVLLAHLGIIKANQLAAAPNSSPP